MDGENVVLGGRVTRTGVGAKLMFDGCADTHSRKHQARSLYWAFGYGSCGVRCTSLRNTTYMIDTYLLESFLKAGHIICY